MSNKEESKQKVTQKSQSQSREQVHHVDERKCIAILKFRDKHIETREL